MRSICKLCQQEEELINSHIVPKFLHKRIDPNRNKPFVIYEDLTVSEKNDLGVKEYLLCEVCDNVIISKYEKYFNEIWYQNSVLPNILTHKKIIHINIDYELFFLFHLSIFWRMSVSNHSTYKDIDFGEKHNENIRLMLLNEDIFNDNYKMIVRIIEKDGQMMDNIIKQPIKSKLLSHNIYSAIYAGCEVSIKISLRKYIEFEKLTLNSNTKHVFVVNYQEVNQIVEISNVLYKVENEKNFTRS